MKKRRHDIAKILIPQKKKKKKKVDTKNVIFAIHTSIVQYVALFSQIHLINKQIANSLSWRFLAWQDSSSNLRLFHFCLSMHDWAVHMWPSVDTVLNDFFSYKKAFLRYIGTADAYSEPIQLSKMES